MTLLLDQHFDRTLDALLARALAANPRPIRLDAWLFEDLPARTAAERRLVQAGVSARIRSAHKPLVHFFLEEAPGPHDAATIRLPSHPHAISPALSAGS